MKTIDKFANANKETQDCKKKEKKNQQRGKLKSWIFGVQHFVDKHWAKILDDRDWWGAIR